MTEKGNYMLEMRKNNEFLDQSSTDDWTLGYAFYIEEVDEEKANAAQKLSLNMRTHHLTKYLSL